MKSLFDAFETYLQGLVNTAISGVLSRLERLEAREENNTVTKRQLEEALDDYDPFPALENDSYRFNSMISLDDYVLKEDFKEEVKEAISDLTFEVNVR